MIAGSGIKLSDERALKTPLSVFPSDFSIYCIEPTPHASSSLRSATIFSGAAVHKSNRRAPAAAFSLLKGALNDANTEEHGMKRYLNQKRGKKVETIVLGGKRKENKKRWKRK